MARQREVKAVLKKVGALNKVIGYDLETLEREPGGWFIDAYNRLYAFSYAVFLGDNLEEALEEALDRLELAEENRVDNYPFFL